jgi:hypothetical protein
VSLRVRVEECEAIYGLMIKKKLRSLEQRADLTIQYIPHDNEVRAIGRYR